MSDETAHYNVRQSASYARTLGITQRATPLAIPWAGELRVRFSDFQVNEICEDGSVLHLRQIGLGGGDSTVRVIHIALGRAELGADFSSPMQKPSRKAQAKDDEEANEGVKSQTEANEASTSKPAQSAEPREITDEDIAALSSLTSPSFADELVEFFKESIQGHSAAAAADKKKSVTSGPIDRHTRGQVHQEVRRIFESKIETTTDGSDCIVATIAAPMRRGDKRGRGGRNQKRATPKPAGAEYLHFTLFKDNRDTMDAVGQIARILKVKPQVIGYAGTKDRRASTAQRCSVRYIRDTSLAGLNGKLRGITTGDYQYRENPIHLGELLGNEFAITIKNCEMFGEAGIRAGSVSQRLDAIRSNVQSALGHMVEHGWINYFGHQRFGTHQIGTHQIGKLILADRFEDAVDSILAYDEETARKADAEEEPPSEPAKRDEHARHLACMLFRTGRDADRAMDLMPRRFTAEGCVMRHLNRQGKQTRRDFVGAVIHITRGLRSMYLHAYQSHVWNHAASRRWELFGPKVVKGDLVIADGVTEAVKPRESEQDQNGGGGGAYDDIINPGDGDDEDGDGAPVRARPLTEEEVSSGRFTIHDVVLPTPGYDVVYPENETGDFYREFMRDEANGGLDPHKMRRLRREFSLPGRYRKLMHSFLGEPSVEFKAYARDEEQMHPTDLDVIAQASAQAQAQAKSPSPSPSHQAQAQAQEQAQAQAQRGTSSNDSSGGSSSKRAHDNEPRAGEDAQRPSKMPKVADEDGGPSCSARTTTDAEATSATDAAAQDVNEGEEQGQMTQTLTPTDGPAGPTAEAAARNEQRDKIAAIVKFQLGKSAYATVALRELMGDAPEGDSSQQRGERRGEETDGGEMKDFKELKMEGDGDKAMALPCRHVVE